MGPLRPAARMRGVVYVAVAILLAGCTQPEADTPPVSPTSPDAAPTTPVVPNTSADVTAPTSAPGGAASPTPPASEPPTQEPPFNESSADPEPVPTPDVTPPLAPAPTAPATGTGTTNGSTTTSGSTSGTPGSTGGTGTSSSPAPATSTSPFVVEPGTDVAGGSFLRGWTRDADGRGFAAQMRAVPGATLRVDSLARIAVEGSAIQVVLEGASIADPAVLDARLFLMDGSAVLATLDLRDPAPNATAALRARATYDLAWQYTLSADASAPVEVAVRIGSV